MDRVEDEGGGEEGYSLDPQENQRIWCNFVQNHSGREKSKTWASLGTYFSVSSYSTYLRV